MILISSKMRLVCTISGFVRIQPRCNSVTMITSSVHKYSSVKSWTFLTYSPRLTRMWPAPSMRRHRSNLTSNFITLSQNISPSILTRQITKTTEHWITWLRTIKGENWASLTTQLSVMSRTRRPTKFTITFFSHRMSRPSTLTAISLSRLPKQSSVSTSSSLTSSCNSAKASLVCWPSGPRSTSRISWPMLAVCSLQWWRYLASWFQATKISSPKSLCSNACTVRKPWPQKISKMRSAVQVERQPPLRSSETSLKSAWISAQATVPFSSYRSFRRSVAASRDALAVRRAQSVAEASIAIKSSSLHASDSTKSRTFSTW